MIIKKPSIFIYTNEPDTIVLKEICAGIEEEGIFYEILKMPAASPHELAWDAANDSMLGSGIGVKRTFIALQMRGLQKGHSVESYEHPDKEQSRKLGSNSARAIKKQSFKN